MVDVAGDDQNALLEKLNRLRARRAKAPVVLRDTGSVEPPRRHHQASLSDVVARPPSRRSDPAPQRRSEVAPSSWRLHRGPTGGRLVSTHDHFGFMRRDDGGFEPVQVCDPTVEVWDGDELVDAGCGQEWVLLAGEDGQLPKLYARPYRGRHEGVPWGTRSKGGGRGES